MSKCTANVTDDVQCGYINGNYVQTCDPRECMPDFFSIVEFDKIPIMYYMIMVCLLAMVIISTLLLVFNSP